eukprot:3427461-Pyramimonas_sp.AAC.1
MCVLIPGWRARRRRTPRTPPCSSGTPLTRIRSSGSATWRTVPIAPSGCHAQPPTRWRRRRGEIPAPAPMFISLTSLQGLEDWSN